ncbi:MAG TPA: site-specific integrase [Chloroflexia bacterium]|nr:site-specific integrase [Chloroflexia bacterium]
MSGKAEKRVGARGITWQFTVELPRDPITGKRRQKLLSAATKREVEDKAMQLRASIGAGGFAEADAKKLTVTDYLKKWLESSKQSTRATTHRRYGDLMRQHVMPFIGGIKLAKLAPLDVQRLYSDRMEVARLSPTTVAQIHTILHKALKQAVRWGLLTRNVTEAVDRPRRITPNYVTWNQTQVSTFLAVSDKDELGALWRLALLTGMRRGEILGLKWEDVDFERSVLAVKRALIRSAGKGFEFSQPKSAAGKRAIALSRSVVQALHKHRIRQLEARLAIGTAYVDQGLVFATALGTPTLPNSLMLRFKRLIAEAGLPMLRFHDLRHTSATLMLANGEHPKIVQERLGHSDVSMTLNRYSHVTMDMQKEAASRLDKLLEDIS